MRRETTAFHLVLIEVIAFSLIIGMSWMNETICLARLLFGGAYSPNWQEAALESGFTALVAIPTIWLTWRLGVLKRLHYHERFIHVCAWCRKVGSHDEWHSIEEFFDSEFKIETTHGLCPSCEKKLRNEL